MIQLLMAAAMGLQGASGLFSASSQARAGKRQANIAAWQAAQASQTAYDEARDTGGALIRQAQTADRVFDLNQGVAEFNSGLALQQGNVQEGRSRDAVDRAIGEQQAFFGGGNLDLSYGSPLAMAAAGAAQGEMDAQIIRAGAQTEWAGQLAQARSIAQQRADTYDSAMIGIEDAYTTAGRRASGAQSSGVINAMTARKQAGFGVASTLFDTATSMVKLGMNAK